MSGHVVALFGEAERGSFKKPHFLQEMPQLVDTLGSPPSESEGILFAVQSILYRRKLVFFRVENEGFSHSDYLYGLRYLQDREKIKTINAVCLPGVGEPKIIAASQIVCTIHKSFLITTQKDLYDYLTAGAIPN